MDTRAKMLAAMAAIGTIAVIAAGLVARADVSNGASTSAMPMGATSSTAYAKAPGPMELSIKEIRPSGAREANIRNALVTDVALDAPQIYCIKAPCIQPVGTITVQIMGMSVTVRMTDRMSISDRYRRPVTKDRIRKGDYVNVYGAQSATEPHTIDAKIVRLASPLRRAVKKEPVICTQEIAWAKNTQTGEVKTFPTPCDIPAGWVSITPPATGMEQAVRTTTATGTAY